MSISSVTTSLVLAALVCKGFQIWFLECGCEQSVNRIKEEAICTKDDNVDVGRVVVV